MQIPVRDPRESGRDYALRCLTENILNLELAPGSMVSENELAAQMGLSRTPVREALMALAKVRLVGVYPPRGWQCCGIGGLRSGGGNLLHAAHF